MCFIQEQLFSLFQQMTPVQQQKLLDLANDILYPPRTYTGRELMALPSEERERLVAHARSTQERQAINVDAAAQTNNQSL